MQIRIVSGIAAAAALILLAGGCAKESKKSTLTVTGAGATFPYPLYSKWFYEYSNAQPEVNFNYQSIGSGGGIRQITEGTVDFGATDAPMTDEEMARLPGPVLHIPTAIGAVAVVYNLGEAGGGLRLSPDVLADIFLGKIRKWDDPRIDALNAGGKLPPLDVVIAHRSDGSGTTDIFTNYLAAVSADWKAKVGRGKSVQWPAGLGGKGNEGVAGIVKQTPGAVGYVELAYATQNKMTAAALRNREGAYVLPTLESTTAAAAAASRKMPADFRLSLVDAAGRDSYPICGLTWILLYTNQKNEAKGKALVSFLRWALRDGQKMNAPLFYAPIPQEVATRVNEALNGIAFPGGTSPY